MCFIIMMGKSQFGLVFWTIWGHFRQFFRELMMSGSHWDWYFPLYLGRKSLKIEV